MVVAACKVLTILALNDDDSKTVIGKAGGIRAIVDGLKRQGDKSEVVKSVCDALWILAKNDENQKSVREVKGMQGIVEGLEMHSRTKALA